jgi:predicted nuclease with TOPRIM domain
MQTPPHTNQTSIHTKLDAIIQNQNDLIKQVTLFQIKLKTLEQRVESIQSQRYTLVRVCFTLSTLLEQLKKITTHFGLFQDEDT